MMMMMMIIIIIKIIIIVIIIIIIIISSTGFEKYIAAIGIEMRVEHAQKTALLGTARILRLVLGC